MSISWDFSYMVALRRSQMERLEKASQSIAKRIAASEQDLRSLENASLLAFGKDVSATPVRKTVPRHGAKHGMLTAQVLRALASSPHPLNTHDLAVKIAPALGLHCETETHKLEERIRYTLKRLRISGAVCKIEEAMLPGQRSTWVLADTGA